MTFLSILGVMETLCNFRLVIGRKTGKEISEPSRLEFLEKFSVKHFAVSDAENNTSGPLHRGGIGDLPLLRTLIAIRQHITNSNLSRERSFWELMESY